MNKEEIEQLVQDFIEKTYEKGIEDARKQMRGSYAMGVIDGKKEAITHEKAIDFLEETGWKEAHDKEMIERGMNIAWECAKKLVLMPSDGGFGNDEMKEIFGTASYHSIINNMSISTVVTKIEDYEERQKQKEEICVGDEVILKRENTKAVVCDVSKYTNKQPYSILMGDDGMTVYVNKNDITKTGKHYDAIDEVLKELRG